MQSTHFSFFHLISLGLGCSFHTDKIRVEILHCSPCQHKPETFCRNSLANICAIFSRYKVLSYSSYILSLCGHLFFVKDRNWITFLLWVFTSQIIIKASHTYFFIALWSLNIPPPKITICISNAVKPVVSFCVLVVFVMGVGEEGVGWKRNLETLPTIAGWGEWNLYKLCPHRNWV